MHFSGLCLSFFVSSPGYIPLPAYASTALSPTPPSGGGGGGGSCQVRQQLPRGLQDFSNAFRPTGQG